MLGDALKKKDWKEAAAKVGLAVLLAAFGPQAVETVKTWIETTYMVAQKKRSGESNKNER